MTKRTRILLIIFIFFFLLLLIAGGVYWYTVSRSNQIEPVVIEQLEVIEEPIEDTIQQPSDEFVIDSRNVGDSVVPPVVEEASTASLRAIALSFIERFGSFSTDSNYANIEELKPSMTATMRAWADEYVEKKRAENAAGDTTFYGVSTRALTVQNSVINDEDGIAQFTINTQRIETTGTNRATSIKFQLIDIRLVKENDVWFVDSALWQ